MRKHRKRSSWRRRILWMGVCLALMMGILAVSAYLLAQRLEPFLKEQTASYLRKRFNSDLEWSRFQVRMSMTSPLRVLLEKGRGALVRAEVAGLVLRHRGRTDIEPLVVMNRVQFEAELSEVMARPARIREIRIQELHLTIPPKGERPRLTQQNRGDADFAAVEQQAREAQASVVIERIVASNTVLRILPRDSRKSPLQFDIHDLRFDNASPGAPMIYAAVLDNALPPGRINSRGSFGPWNAAEPGDTPMSGDYTFQDADLGVFKGIGGILSSTGTFEGQLNQVTVDGETHTPQFRLNSGAAPLPLHTKFHAIVDGTNGNTRLEPVEATLNTTRFTAQGSVTRDPRDPAKSIVFDVTMEDGRVEDMLLLAVRADPPMLEGKMNLQMKLELVPMSGELADRLRLNGKFELLTASFTSPTVQEKIDTLSRRGLGKPNQQAIANVPSDFVGEFSLQDGRFSLAGLEFGVPGALVQLDGTYLFGSELLDFRGQLRLQARLSKTMTGWKRILLTPVDPFFAKEGYGTVLNIKVSGTRDDPQFGLDR